MAEIRDYQELHALSRGALVQDASGEVWCVVKSGVETWLCPFSDEYHFSVRPDGKTYSLDTAPELPLTDLGIVSTGGA